MYYKKLCWIIMAAVFLSSCELLGFGDEEKPEPELRPELMWEVFNEAGRNGPSPVIEDSSVYVAGQDAVSKLNLQTGDGRWLTESERVFWGDIYGKLLVDDRALYVRHEQVLNAYDKSDGQPLWSLAFEDSLASYSVPRAVSLADQSDTRVFIGTEKKLLVVDKEQGIVEQSITPQLPVETVSSKRLNIPVAGSSSDRVYLLSSYIEEGSEQIRGRVAAYQIADGALLWESSVPWPIPDLSIEMKKPTLQMTEAKGLLLVMAGSGMLAFDTQTGEQVWQHLFFENRTDVIGGSVFVQRHDYLYAAVIDHIIKLSVSDGAKIWDVRVGAGFIEQLHAEDDRLYFTSGLLPGDTFISIADEQTGEVLGSIAPSDRGFIDGFTPAFAADGRFIVDVGRTTIYGYQLPE